MFKTGFKETLRHRCFKLCRKMLGDAERVRAALRAGAQPQQVFGRDSLTKRVLKPEAIAHGPDGDVLILVRFGRVTMLAACGTSKGPSEPGAGIRAVKEGKSRSH